MEKSGNAFLSQANKIVAYCFGIQAVGIGTYICFGVFFNPLMAEFGWSRALISGASSLAFFISGLFAIYVGRINDRVGPKLIMTITAVFLGVGLMLMSTIQAIWQLYMVFGVIFGIGLSSIDVIALSTIARWFPQKRGVMTGIVKVGTGAGQFFFPFLASVFIAGIGWRNAYLVVGGISILALCMIAQGLKREPEEGGGPLSSTPEKDQSNGSNAGKESFVSLDFSQASRTVQLWLLCIVNFTILSCLMSIMVHVVPYGRDIGVSVHKAASVLSIIGLVSMVGRFSTGFIIDQIGSKRSMLLSLCVLITGLAWLQGADVLWKLYLFASIYGFAHGSFFTVISPMVAELFGTSHHGSIFGLVVCFGTTGGAVGPFLAGYLFDMSGSYALPFSLMLVITVLGMGLLCGLKPVSPDIS